MNVHLLKSDVFDRESVAYPRAVWGRYIKANTVFFDAITSEDEASYAARTEIENLDLPWFPVLKRRWDYTNFEEKDEDSSRFVVEGVRLKNTRQEGDRVLVEEYQPAPREARLHSGWDFPTKSGAMYRWEPYPGATTGDEALKQSTERGKREWRSCKARMAWIKRKHRVVLRDSELEQSNSCVVEIAREIADARDASPAMTAVRLALKMSIDGIAPDSKSNTGYRLNDCELDALKAAYRYAAETSGYDPLAEWRATPGI